MTVEFSDGKKIVGIFLPAMTAKFDSDFDSKIKIVERVLCKLKFSVCLDIHLQSETGIQKYPPPTQNTRHYHDHGHNASYPALLSENY